MTGSKIPWQKLTLSFTDPVFDALQQQHYAAQLIALAGKHLLPQQPDDSNTNMQYLPETGILAGNPLMRDVRVALHLTSLELSLLDKSYKSIGRISLAGKTFNQGFEVLKDLLNSGHIDITYLSDQLHYRIPDHPLANGGIFSISDKIYFQENALIRNNNEVILNKIIADQKHAAAVRVWPHHFDTGTFIPLAVNAQGSVIRSMGLGWAIPDTMVNEPYFYLSFWSEENNNMGDIESLPAGKWMMPEWNGAVLRHSEILKAVTAQEQYNMVELFFSSGMTMIKEEINKNHDSSD